MVIYHWMNRKAGGALIFAHPLLLLSGNLLFPKQLNNLKLGTANYVGAIALGKSLSLINQLGIKNIEKRIRKTTDYLHEKLTQLNVTKTTHEDPEKRSG